ncbi:hypothetical protein [Mailhella sp.]|uniref:hypothetical protein n=1 Tax=Mailhella sp. TaxID=1981029 RepID=UPI003AB86A40
MEPLLAELRAIELREMQIEEEKAQLRRRKLELLELDQGTRKSKRSMISRQNGKALFAGLKRSTTYEHSKAQ